MNTCHPFQFQNLVKNHKNDKMVHCILILRTFFEFDDTQLQFFHI